MKTCLMLGVLVATLILPASWAEAGVVIDHFKDGFFSLTVNSATTEQIDDQTGLVVLGGRRKTTLDWVSGGATNTVNAQVPNVGPTLHYLTLSDDVTTKSTLKLQYGLDNNLDVDLTQGGMSTGVELVFMDSDLGSTLKMTLTDTSGNSFTVPDISPAGPNNVVFNFTDYITGNPSLDPTHIKYITFDLIAKENGDYRIDAIDTKMVPEPATMLGMLVGVGGLPRYMRRRRKA